MLALLVNFFFLPFLESGDSVGDAASSPLNCGCEAYLWAIPLPKRALSFLLLGESASLTWISCFDCLMLLAVAFSAFLLLPFCIIWEPFDYMEFLFSVKLTIEPFWPPRLMSCLELERLSSSSPLTLFLFPFAWRGLIDLRMWLQSDTLFYSYSLFLLQALASLTWLLSM